MVNVSRGIRQFSASIAKAVLAASILLVLVHGQYSVAGDPPRKPVVQFFTIEAGSGHKNIEKAIKDDIPVSQLNKEATVMPDSVVINDYLTPHGDFMLRRSYELMAEYAPALWNFSYSVLPKIIPPAMQRNMYSGLITPELTAQLQKNNPDLIFCTQTMLPVFVDILKENGALPASTKVVNFVTDYSVNQSYNTSGLIIVPHQSLKDQLIALGKDPALIKVVDGIPAGLRFRDPYDKKEERKKLAEKIASDTGVHINTENPLIIASGGGQALEMDKVLEFLPNWHPDRPINVVLNFGNKDAMKEKAERLIAGGKLDPNITFVTTGYVDNAPYFKAADLIVGKPGGSVTAEAIALRKTLFAQSYVAGQEKKNFDFLTGIGVVQDIKGHMDKLNHIDSILALAEQSEKAIDQHYPTATEIPTQVLNLTRDYLNGVIPESATEKAELAKKILARDTKKGTLAAFDQDAAFEKWDHPNTEIIYLEDPQVDLAVRKTLLSRAERSIDIASFSQASDHSGMEIIRGLRRAANSGVQVRSMYERYGTRLEGDKTKHTQQLLTDSSLVCPAGVVCGTIPKRIAKGLSPDDFFHMKFTIIDAGLPSMMIVGFGGRNNGKLSDIFGDSAFVLRAIDPTKPWIGEDFASLYNDQFQRMKDLHGVIKPDTPSKEALEKLKFTPELNLRTEEQRKTYGKILNVLNSIPREDGDLAEMVFHPRSMQLLTNSALKNAVDNKFTYTVNRRANLPNNVLAELHSRLPLADGATISSYIFNLPEPVKTDLLNLVKRGGSLRIVTNPREVMEGMTRAKTLDRSLAVTSTDVTLSNLIPFAQAAKVSGAKFEVALLDPERAANHLTGYKYLHRKLVTLNIRGDELAIEEGENGQLEISRPLTREVYSGSDNMTKSSARKNAEVVLAMEDPRLADHLEAQVQKEIETFYTVYTPDQILQKAAELPAYRCFSSNVVKSVHEWLVDQVF